MSTAWGQAAEFTAADVRGLPLFAEVDERAAALIAQSAHALEVTAGETIIERWQGTRHFYVVIEGAARIERDGEVLLHLGPGEFFGEVAAMDWGAGFGYVRTATVVAAAATRLLVLPPSALGELLRIAPGVDRRVRSAARERMQHGHGGARPEI